MKKFSCPSCGAEVEFVSAAAVFSVCPFCRSMLVRQDMSVELIGKQAQLPDDQSPFQVGTGGKFRGVNFTLQGRFRMKWASGFWNEWFAWCDDGRTAWLAEAQGFLSFYFEVNKSGLPAVDAIFVGQTVVIESASYRVADIKQAEVAGSDGELPFKAPAGRKSTSVDLDGPEGRTATIEYSGEDVRAYAGFYCEFDDFKFSNLRSLDGW